MELSFLTYNIHKGIGNDNLYRLDRIIDVIRESKADIICLQEVDQFVPRSNFEDTAQIIAEALQMHYQLALNVKLKHGNYGNATLSRYPILDYKNINLTWGIKKKRGCLVTTMELPRGRMGVFNYHLGLAGFERIWQAKKLLSDHYLKENEHIPLIFLGDSNDRSHKLNPVFLKHGFHESAHGHRSYTFPSYAPIFRLDKIYFNGFFSLLNHEVIKNKLTKVTSDHYPVLTKFIVHEKNQRPL